MLAPKMMFEAALEARKNAYAPYSNFFVGCSIKAEDDRIYTGCNIENASYGLTICAEANALCGLIVNGQKKVKEVLVVACEQTCPPCGSCRQRLSEFSTLETIVHLCQLDGSCQSVTLGELLPYPFKLDAIHSSKSK